MERKKKKAMFFIAVVAAFAVFNWWSFGELKETTSKTPRKPITGSVLGRFESEEGNIASYEAKVGSQRQLIYIGNGVLVLLSVGGYLLFLKDKEA